MSGEPTTGPDFIGPIVPRPPVRRDHVLAILLCASLVVHVTILLPSLLRKSDADAAQPNEIPVEIVQLPPPAPPQPKQAPPKQPAPKQAAARPPAPKPPAPQPKQAARKAPDPPKPQKAAFKPEPKQPSTTERLKELLGPMAAIALPGASPVGEDSVSYSQLVLSKVAKAKKEGRYKGIPGAAGVSFTIGDAGEVVKVEVVRPSGDPSLDAEAIAMVKRGAPYPPPPPGGRRDYAITLRFQPVI